MRTLVDAVPYAWPYDGPPAPGQLALVLVGLQPALAWMDPAGEVRLRCEELRTAAGQAGIPVYHVRHGRTPATPLRLPGLPEAGSAGWSLLGSVAGPSDILVDVPALNGFYASGLDAALYNNGRRYLVLAGYGYEAGIHSTLRAANDRGYECLVLEDACASVEADLHAAATKTIEMSGGIFGAYATTSAFLKALG